MVVEALNRLKIIGSAQIDVKKPPSPVQAFLGAISADVIALILYKLTATIEAALNHQTMSDNLSGYCEWFVLPCNICFWHQFGLFLYSALLAFNSLMEGGSDEETESKAIGQSGSPNSTSESATDGAELTSSQGVQNPNNIQK